MSSVIDKQTNDLIYRLNKADQDILKLKAIVNKILNKSTSLVATGSFGESQGVPSSYDGLDTTAIHSDIPGEIEAIAEKTAIVDADLFVMEDSEAGNIKKKVQVTNIVGSLLAEIIALGIPFDDIINPNNDVNFTFGNKHLHLTFVNPDTEGGLILEGLGNFQGKTIVHLHQHTGNVTAEAWLRTVEWIDAQITPERWSNDAGTNWLSFKLAALSGARTLTYPDKDLTFAIDTAAEAIAAVEAAGLALASTKVITSADEDLIFLFGRAGFNSINTDRMTLAHRDMNNDTDYAISQNAVGDTFINAKTGKTVWFLINGITGIMTYNASGLQMGLANARITEFSTDGTMAGNSDVAVPTEKALKTYVDLLDRETAYEFFPFSGASFSGSRGAVILMPQTDVNCGVDFNFYVTRDVTTLVVVYRMDGANAWSCLWFGSSQEHGEDFGNYNILNADNTNDFPAGTASILYEIEITISGVVQGDWFRVGCVSDASNTDNLFIYGAYIK